MAVTLGEKCWGGRERRQGESDKAGTKEASVVRSLVAAAGSNAVVGTNGTYTTERHGIDIM